MSIYVFIKHKTKYTTMNTIEPDKEATVTVGVGADNVTNNDHLMKALLSWSVNRQKEYLKGEKLAYSGNKSVLAKRISSTLEKESAIEIVKEFDKKLSGANVKKRKTTNINPQEKAKKGKRDKEKEAAEKTIQISQTQCQDILSRESRAKTLEKRKSMISHFNHFLKCRSAKIEQGHVGRNILNFDDITYDDVDKGKLVGEWATYLADDATNYRKPNGVPISYQTATGYMSSFKCTMIDLFHEHSIAKQFDPQVWARMLTQVRSTKFEYARIHKIKLFGSKKSANRCDLKSLFAICLWDGSLGNAEFMNLFQCMIHNCGRGSEIAISQFDQLSMKTIVPEDGLPEYDTLQQHLLRIKTEGMFSDHLIRIYKYIKLINVFVFILNLQENKTYSILCTKTTYLTIICLQWHIIWLCNQMGVRKRFSQPLKSFVWMSLKNLTQKWPVHSVGNGK